MFDRAPQESDSQSNFEFYRDNVSELGKVSIISPTTKAEEQSVEEFKEPPAVKKEDEEDKDEEEGEEEGEEDEEAEEAEEENEEDYYGEGEEGEDDYYEDYDKEL